MIAYVVEAYERSISIDLNFDSLAGTTVAMQVRTKENPRIVTRNADAQVNGFLVPLYNIHDGFFASGKEPQQVYLTVIAPREIKGPHLHLIRTGCFTCVKGNVRFVLKSASGYHVFHSGEDHKYLSVEVAAGTPAALQNLGNEDAYVLNMPNPAWTPSMNDEHSADFSDFDFSKS
jgi:dTDP-4-dehydrorhamnose 3,5-epimerase